MHMLHDLSVSFYPTNVNLQKEYLALSVLCVTQKLMLFHNMKKVAILGA